MSTLKTTQIAHPSSVSNNIVLNSDGSATIADLTATTIQGTIQSGTAVASTSGTAIDFTGIPSWVKRVTVMFDGVSTNGSSNIQLQVGDGSVSATGYESSAFTPSSNYINNGSTGFILTALNTGGVFYRGAISLVLSGVNAWTSFHTFGTTGGSYMAMGGGNKTLSGTLDRIRITTVNGTDTFDAGSINIAYEG
jgi:hypothetical protein